MLLSHVLKEYRLIVVDPNSPIHFRLDVINPEQLLALNNDFCGSLQIIDL